MGLNAIVAGATGLIGSRLLRLLLDDIRVEHIAVLVRRQTGIVHPKLSEHLVDFEKMTEWAPLVKGDVLFSALGTTLQEAGSKEKQFRIDYTYQYELARIAAENGVSDFVLVSSAGASPESGFFYPRIKGELEEAVRKLNFRRIFILRPSFLEGKREEKRKGEKLMLFLTKAATFVFFRKFRPVRAWTVAQAMVNVLFFNDRASRVVVYEPNEIFQLASL